MIIRYRTGTPGNQLGLTLIEIMIAMLLGILLLLGISSMFMSNKRIYKEQDANSRLQENARFAMEMMMYDIRMAGYSGCADDLTSVVNHVSNNDDNLLDFGNALEGLDSAVPTNPASKPWSPSGSVHIINNMLAGTDALSIRYLIPAGLEIEEDMPPTSSQFKMANVGDLKDYDIVAISDCQAADIFIITNVQTSNHINHPPGNNPPLANGLDPPENVYNGADKASKRYEAGAGVIKFIARRYYIGLSYDADGDGVLDPEDIPSLYRVTNYGVTEELIQGVEQMQLSYGIDDSGDGLPEKYRPAGHAELDDDGEWSRVTSVRLALAFRTVEQNNQIEPDTKTHTMLGGVAAGGAVIGPKNDYHRRRIVTATVDLRNRP